MVTWFFFCSTAVLILPYTNAQKSLLPPSAKELSCALKDVWAVRVCPDIAIDPTLLVPSRAAELFDTVAGQLPTEEAFLFWLARCQFNAGLSIDNHLKFHGAIFGGTDENIRSAIQAVLPAFNNWKQARDGVAERMDEFGALKRFNSTVVRYSCSYQLRADMVV